MNKEPWIQLADGRAFEPYKPKVEDISIEVIAHALSKICRFNGHTKRFYSVAEHSIHVANILPDNLKIWGLLHDAHEAYTGFGDVCNPVKSTQVKYLEELIDGVIAEYFGLFVGEFYNPLIREADLRMLHTEKVFLLEPGERDWDIQMPTFITDMHGLAFRDGNPEIARVNFLETFRKLQNGQS